MHYIPRNVSVHPHQASHRVTTFDALVRNNPHHFSAQRCASSSIFFIRSLQLPDAFYKSSFSPIIWCSCMTVTNWGTRLFGLAVSVWSIRSRDFSVLVVSVSTNFGQIMKSCRNLTCSLFNANVLKSTKGFIKKKLQTWYKDPKVNQRQQITFIIISK